MRLKNPKCSQSRKTRIGEQLPMFFMVGRAGLPNELPQGIVSAMQAPFQVSTGCTPEHFLLANIPLAHKDSQNLRQMRVFLQIRYEKPAAASYRINYNSAPVQSTGHQC
jgi:hypothetical protein